jgi:hypothetical protein
MHAYTHARVVVKDRLAARKQQRHLFALVRSGVLVNEGLTTLNVELAGLGSILRIALRLAINLFHRMRDRLC